MENTALKLAYRPLKRAFYSPVSRAFMHNW